MKSWFNTTLHIIMVFLVQNKKIDVTVSADFPE